MKRRLQALVGAGLALGLLVGNVQPTLGCIAIPRDRPGPVPYDIKLPEQRAFLFSEGKTQHMILSVKYEGPPGEFAWVIPTETQAKVDVQAGAPFHELWKATTPRRSKVEAQMPTMTRGGAAAPGAAPPVQVLERKAAGPYDVAVLKASTSGGLYDWLKKNGFSTNSSVRQALSSYVKKDWYFVAARIRPGKEGQVGKSLVDGTIAPLKISYKASELSYPLRVTAGNPGTSKIELFVLNQKPPQHAGFQVETFALTPKSPTAFEVNGGPGTDLYQDAFPTLRKLLPKGGNLSKYTAILPAEQRKRELSFAKL